MASPAMPTPLYNYTQKVRKITAFKANNTKQNKSYLLYIIQNRINIKEKRLLD